MIELVLDASVVIAYLQSEPGSEQAGAALGRGVISAINLAEVAQKLVKLGEDDLNVRLALRALPCSIAEFDGAQAIEAGLLLRTTATKGLSLGDRACLALAKARRLPAVTADRAWTSLDLGVEVVLIR
jgi:PIN domain nuclease of toxin-antitoxin system